MCHHVSSQALVSIKERLIEAEGPDMKEQMIQMNK